MWEKCLDHFLNLTPAQAPFSGMNSAPAVSTAFWSLLAVAMILMPLPALAQSDDTSPARRSCRTRAVKSH
jgi:hypothetical protein